MINIPKLLISTEIDNISDYIKNIGKELNVSSSNIHWIDSNDYLYLYNSLFQLFLFDELKIFVIDLDNFFNNKKLEEKIIKIISDLHNKPISNLVYFFTKSNNQTIKKIFKEVLILEKLDEKNKLSYIKDYLKSINLKLSNNELSILDKKLIPNQNIIKNEINKLNIDNLYLINEIVYDYYETNPFQIIEIILKNDIKKLKKFLDEVLIDINSYHKIFNIISNKLVQLYLINDLLISFSAKEISKIINKSLYLINMDINLINSVSIFTVKYYIDVLYQIELDIRQHNLDPIKTLKLNLLKGHKINDK